MNRNLQAEISKLEPDLQSLILRRIEQFEVQAENSIKSAVSKFYIYAFEDRAFWLTVYHDSVKAESVAPLWAIEQKRVPAAEILSSLKVIPKELQVYIPGYYLNIKEILQVLSKNNSFWSHIYAIYKDDIVDAIEKAKQKYKTITEWFSQVENADLKTILMYNLSSREDVYKSSFNEAINEGFTTSRVDQPKDFWDDVLRNRYNPDAAKGYADIIRKRLPYVVPMTRDNNSVICEIEGYSKTITFYPAPFSNCQNFCIGAFENILPHDKRYVREVIAKLARIAGKWLLVLDVHAKYVNKIKEICPNIVFQQPYVSTNNSQMVFLMLNTKNIGE